jgi:hypothetical protein
MAFKDFNNQEEAQDHRKAQLLVAALRLPSSIFKKGWTTHASRDLLEMQPDGTLGKKTALHLASHQDSVHNVARMDIGGQLPLFAVCPQGRTVSHPHSHQTEGLTDLLGLAAED